MARHSKKLYCPLTFLPDCVCPKCHQPHMAYKQTENIYATIDEDGLPGDFVVNSSMLFTCLSCGYTTEDEFVLTDNGFRYVFDGDKDRIKEMNSCHYDEHYLPDDKNPLVKEAKGKGE